MRFAPSRVSSRSAWILAAASALVLGSCGGSEEKAPPVAAAPVEKGPEPKTNAAPTSATVTPTAGEESGLSVSNSKVIFGAAQIEGPIEYEEGVDKPLVASFPTETKLEQARPKIENLPSDDELLGRPLVINGRIVPFEEIKTQVCLGADGVGEIEAFKLRVFVDEEKKRRTDAGAGREQTELGAEEFGEYMKDIETELKAEYPEGQVGMDELMNSWATKDPKEKLRVQREFEKLFLPEDPAQFPPATLDAILLQEGGDGVLEHFKTSFEDKLKNGKPTRMPPK